MITALGALMVPFAVFGKKQLEFIPTRLHEEDLRGELDELLGPRSLDEPIDNLADGKHHYGPSALRLRDESMLFNPLLRRNPKALAMVERGPIDGMFCEVIYDTKLQREVSFSEMMDAKFEHCFKGSKAKPVPSDRYIRSIHLIQYMGIEFEYDSPDSYVKNKTLALSALANLFINAVDQDLIHRTCYGPCCSLRLDNFGDPMKEMLLIWPVGTEKFDAVNLHPGFVMEGESSRITIKLDGTLKTWNPRRWNEKTLEYNSTDENDPAFVKLKSYGGVVKREAARKGLNPPLPEVW